MPVRRDSRTKKWFFRATVRCPNGETHRVFGTPGVQGRFHDLPNTKVGAKEAERRAINSVMNGGDPNPKPQPKTKKEVITLAQFAKEHFMPKARLENKHSSAVTKQTILDLHVLPQLGDKPVEEIAYRDFEDLKIRLAALKGRKALKPKSINNVLTVVRSLLAEARKRELITTVPHVDWLKTTIPKFDFLTFEEAERLVAAGQGEWRAMIFLALRSGLRQGELLALRWEDVDLVKGRLTVNQAVSRGVVSTPKSGRSREVALSPETVSVLKAQRHERSELVFCNSFGRMLTKGQCKHPLWRTCERAKLGRSIGWHAMRHTFASHLVMRGVSLKAVQELLGHSDIRMTMRYSHLAPEVKRDAVALLDVAAGAETSEIGSHAAAKTENDS